MHITRFISTLSSISFAAAWTTYVVPYSSGGDDTPALAAAFSSNANLATDATILFQKGVTYNMLTPIKFPYFQNVIVSVEGNITYAADIAKTQAIVQSSSFPGHWFHFSGGKNVTLQGSQDSNWGWVNANGQKWWDAMTKSSLRVNRPHGWGFGGITNGEIKNMKLWQPVAWSFSVSGNNVHVHDNTVIAISYSSATPYNTDGFSGSGTNLVFDNNVVYNGDDCLTVGSPANNITFRNGYCNGSHGLSIGSLGQNGAVADVQNVLIENVVMENCLYAARFKSWAGGKGTAKNIIWRGITLKKVRLPIYITQTYSDGNAGNYESSTSIENFTFQNFTGTIDDSKGNSVTGSTGKEVVVFELFQGTAKLLLAKGVSTRTVSGSQVMVMCDPSTISNDVGFKCWDGLYQATSAGA